MRGGGADFEADHAWQLDAGGARVALQMDAGVGGKAAELVVAVYVTAGSSATFVGDGLQLASDGAPGRLALPVFVSMHSRAPGEPAQVAAPGMPMAASAAPTVQASAKPKSQGWIGVVAIPPGDARSLVLQLPDVVVDGVTHALPPVTFTASHGWAWVTAM